ncbi:MULTISPECIES: aminopeptidase [Brevibacillus]|uniref:Aminopeptidase n=1 Tax=Brevibacillus invocatus TaxID=173959 RepID=A0A3M8CLE0_9BACL|nr:MULTISPECIES: aminopeptidase [Brevibacillus]MCM3079850.1 aminopeptidase [Brevibacillus invocatus]MCM3430043.1 aminopeptidase [Brevibacillus invocatus]MDH4616601.1 aminopeptidase [Brevibacillus sp. AY1]RNB76419.1 aminopeptidase [Brevibacillus invocatus]
MKDPRLERLAHILVNYSVRVQPEENILIHAKGEVPDLVSALVKEIYQAGGNPYVQLVNPMISRDIAMNCNEEQLAVMADHEKTFMEKMDGYIGIRAASNINEMADVPGDKLGMYARLYELPVMDIRVPQTKWVVLRYPNPSMAQLANMSTAAFEDFYFQVCTMDYAKMDKAMDSLVELMNRTDRVRITGPGTDLSFSIKDIPAVKCSGLRNIPDGEVYTAPVRDSVNGTITHNAPTPYNGFTFENVRLTFENGKIVDASANDTERLNQILDTDEGARYIGEFAIGVNPFIRNPMKDILFDEKIDGSFHFTPGQCYDTAYNGNKSSVHWDMVSIQRPDWGGGEIWFDDVLIRKDGRFVIPELEILNPENLGAE